jgi:hypothetical protein
LYGVTTSSLENVPPIIGTGKTTTDAGCEVLNPKQCEDNLSIKSINEVYSKRFTLINSYGRACNNVIAAGN